MKNIQLVIFDMAGTAINEDNVVYKTLAQALQQYGFEVPLEMVLELGAGKEKRQAIVDILASMLPQPASDEQVNRIHAAFQQLLDRAYEENPMSVFEGVAKLLPILRAHDIKVGFNTGYQREVAELILAKVGLTVGVDLDVLVTATEAQRGRPAPDMIDLVCEQVNVPAAQSLKVGDSAIDIEEGRNAGVALAVGITTGAQTREQLQQAGPDAVIDDMMELLSVLELPTHEA